MSSRSLGHRAPLLWLVLPFAGGLIVGQYLGPTAVVALPTIATCAAVAAAAASWWPVPHGLWMTAIVAAFGCAGAASYPLHRQRLPDWDDRPPREAELNVQVTRLFASRDATKASGLARVTAAEGPMRGMVGQRIYFSCWVPPGAPRPRRSAVITMSGVVIPLPPRPAADSFEGYLASAGVNFRFIRGRVRAVVRAQHPYYAFCDRAAARCKAILGLGIETTQPRLAGLLRAMMLGETRELTEDQRTVFMQSGTMHLFAISGLNIGVIATAIQALLLLARLPAWPRFLLGLPLLWLFVDITGAAPSAVRAFGMAAFFQAAFVFRRPPNPLAALTASAAVVLLLAPLQLFSASFLMSYSIVAALLVLGLPLAETWDAHAVLWRHLPRATWNQGHRFLDWAWRWLVATLAIGVATTLASTLTSIQFFKLLIPGALFANLILIPAAIVVTVAGFASLLFGLLGLTPWAALTNHAAALVLLLIEWLVRLSVTLPAAFVPAQFRQPWVGGLSLGLLLLVLLTGYALRWRHALWLLPFAVVAATLVFGTRYG